MESHVIETSFGPLTLVSDGENLTELRFGKNGGKPTQRPSKLLKQAEREVHEFFAGKRKEFTVPFVIRGTPFQNRVWKALCKIPFGKTCSYGELAKRIGSPQSARAVGMALGRNRLAIVVPCHRVIGSNGSLVGFGGGLDMKQRLLEHESQSHQPKLKGLE